METTTNFFQLWLAIYQEAVQFCNAVDKLPVDCECGDGAAHLEGRCPCCISNRGSLETHSEDCTVLLTRLRADLTILIQDFAQLAAPIGKAAIGVNCLELRRGVFLTAEDLHRIAKAVDRIQEEVAGFRRTCDLSELRSIKRSTVELREHFNQLNHTLTPVQDVRAPEPWESL